MTRYRPPSLNSRGTRPYRGAAPSNNSSSRYVSSMRLRRNRAASTIGAMVRRRIYRPNGPLATRAWTRANYLFGPSHLHR